MYLDKAEADRNVVKSGGATIERYVFLEATGLTFWSRMKLAGSVLLTPITLLILGRSIALHPETRAGEASDV